jgi:Polyketide cyclase / dehydrase and lipid transport
MTRVLIALFGGVAALLVTVLLIGVVLPNTWEAKQTVVLPHAPEALFPFIVDLNRWDAWTVWSEFESVVSDPSAGVGATRSWDDAEYGEGRIQLTEVIPGSSVRYLVEVDGGARVEGEISLVANQVGSTVTWIESGDFGWNPLMGFMARRLPESQEAQMREGLTRLGEAVGGGSASNASNAPN